MIKQRLKWEDEVHVCDINWNHVNPIQFRGAFHEATYDKKNTVSQVHETVAAYSENQKHF